MRRALTPDELAALIASARSRPLEEALAARVRAGVSPQEEARLRRLGEARGLVYALAARTGLRRGEPSRLVVRDLDLDRGGVTIRAASAKSRKEQWVPLRADLVAALKAWLGEASPSARVVEGKLFPTVRTFHADLAAAGIEARDEAGVRGS